MENYEQLLCAAFESGHRQIVNITAETWNRVFENTTDLQYPEQLKTVLRLSQTYVDLVLPGLGSVNTPSDVPHRAFVDSQDDLGVVSLNSYSLRSKTPRSLASGRSSSPAVTLSSPSKRQVDGTPKRRTRAAARDTPTTRPRHDDSQLHFVAVESPGFVDNQESQVLTERQKEVRERQKDAAALFTELRSSSRPSSRQSGRRRSTRSSAAAAGGDTPEETSKDGTPERRTGYEDYVSSTPTPRRFHQPLAIDMDDQDMTDPPSSPPEPRPFPLLPEIQSRSSSRGEIHDDWPLSSSPASASPVLGHHDGADMPPGDVSIEDEDQDAADGPKRATQESVSAVNDSFRMDVVPSSAPSELVTATTTTSPKTHETPATPSRHADPAHEELRSEQEDFVDALTSPQRSSPIQSPSGDETANQQGSQAGDASFVMSDGDERSMLRLIVELDSRSCPLPLNQHPAESPERAAKRNGMVLDCITVATPDEKSRDETPKRPRKSRSPAVASSASEITESPSRDKSERKKRKRAASKPESHRKKRRSASAAAPAAAAAAAGEDAAQVRGSQSPGTTNACSSQGDMESVEHGALSPAPTTPVTRSAKRRNMGEEKNKEKDKDTDTELESQLVAEQQAASRSQSQQAEEEEDVKAAIVEPEPSADVEMDSADLPHGQAQPAHDPVDEPIITPATAEKPPTPATKDSTPMLESLSGVLAQLRSTALSRGEVYKMEDVLMDIKRELYEAERRGRS